MKNVQEIFNELFLRYPALAACRADILSAYGLLLECAENRGLIMVCGNGGSAADCEHIVGELMKGFCSRRPLNRFQKEGFGDIEGGPEMAEKLQQGIRAVSLVSQTGLISAFANDVDPALVYAQQVYAYAGTDADAVVLCLTTSGSSENVVNAAKAAKAAGIRSIAITGQTGGAVKNAADVTVKLPALEPYEVQELTLPVYHALCAALEAALFGDA